MANQCQHSHTCVDCKRPYECSKPECMNLPGPQGACTYCLEKYGWAQKQDTSNDWNAM